MKGEKVAAPYYLKDMAADAIGLLDALGIQQAHMVGASMGGMIVQIVAAQYPQRTRSMVSIYSSSGRPGLPQGKPEALAMLTAQPEGPAREQLVKHGMKLRQTIGSPGYPTPEAELRAFVEKNVDRRWYPEGAARQYLSVIASGDRVELLKTIKVPTLVMHGEEDPLLPIACGRDVASLVPGAQFQSYPGWGHDFPGKLIPTIADRIAGFLQRCFMKFGIFYEHQLPRPWGPMSEYQLLQDSLTQIELADRLGYDYAWEVEHHFLEEYSHSSAPEVFLGAASQRTKRIRLGHGVVQLTTNQPHRVAERIATLDLLSGGRVDLGMGEAAGPAELHPFNIRVRDKRERWEEAVKAIVPMFTRESWEFHGQYYDFEARNVIPKPFQKPHPPLWVACSNIQTIGKAGEWGMGALGFTFVTPEAARAWVHKYYNNLLNNSQKLTDYPSNPNVAMVSGFMCAPTDAEAEAKAAGWTFFIFALSYYGRKGVDAPGTSDLWKEYQSWKGGPEEKKALKSGLIGSPETIRRKLRQFQASRVDQVILLNQAGKTSHQDICESLELFAKEVMPEFHAAEAEHAAWKQKVMAREIVLEDLDVQKYDIYSHQNEHIVRLTPEQLKQKMAEKEAAAKRA